MRGLEAAVRGVLDRRLLRATPRPIAIALSGGGDSLALTLIADAWARDAARDIAIINVDHRLRTESAVWTARCEALAARLGRPFHALAWEGDKPATGLPAAARAARHRLLADAARNLGARVVLMGHTADDLAEAEAMRAGGSTVPDPRAWAPSPVWPEGRGVFILRPLLDIRRADLRAWLGARGETWIDDPANDDPRYARSRARAGGLEPGPRLKPPPLELAGLASEQAGVITLARAVLRIAASADARRFIALAAVCAGGGERLPAGARTERLTEMLRADGSVDATLAGARVQADANHVRVFREAGEAARGGLAPVRGPAVWDGRFEIAEAADIQRLSGLARRLPATQAAALKALPAAARGALPALVERCGAVICPALSGTPSLVGERLRAAAGLVQREPA